MEVILPEEREALIAQLAKPRRRPPVKYHSAAALELLALSDRIFEVRGTPPVAPQQERERPPWRHWPRCRHKHYHLSCAEYEMLELEADGFCDICRDDYRDMTLEIDHDHAIGWRAVRGLICASCNGRLGLIEKGRRQPNRDVQNYLRDPWHARVGLEDLGCPPGCERWNHATAGGPAPGISRTRVDQQRHLAAQLWALT